MRRCFARPFRVPGCSTVKHVWNLMPVICMVISHSLPARQIFILAYSAHNYNPVITSPLYLVLIPSTHKTRHTCVTPGTWQLVTPSVPSLEAWILHQADSHALPTSLIRLKIAKIRNPAIKLGTKPAGLSWIFFWWSAGLGYGGNEQNRQARSISEYPGARDGRCVSAHVSSTRRMGSSSLNQLWSLSTTTSLTIRCSMAYFGEFW